MLATGLLTIVIVMLVKEMGIPIPVPSDLIMITAGIQVATGTINLVELIVFLELAIFLGGSLQFLLVRSAGRAFVYRAGKYVGLSPARLDRAGDMLRKRGPAAIFLGLNLPGARAGIIPAAGLAGLTYRSFAPAMLSGSSLFHGWHIALGFLVGPPAVSILAQLHVPIVPVVLLLAVVGLAGWLILRRRKGVSSDTADRLHAWTEASCPVCLAIAALEQMKQPAETGYAAVK
ncbi:MAG: DedA family protein [Chloroflexi bacterium]|nr:DedA family protein [Chloroflexota bacterium]